MKKLIVALAATSALFFIGGCSFFQGDELPNEEEAVAKAAEVYAALKTEGTVFDNGPCISENLLGDDEGIWVADIVHSPREEIDNKPENQCSRYRSGDAKHFVELDLEGNLVRSL